MKANNKDGSSGDGFGSSSSGVQETTTVSGWRRAPGIGNGRASRFIVGALVATSLVGFAEPGANHSGFFVSAMGSSTQGIFDRLEKKMGEKERMM